MRKEDILARSRQENEGMDEREKYIYIQAGSWAAKIGCVICMLLTLVEALSGNGINYGNWAIYDSIYASAYLIRGIKLKSEGTIIGGVIMAVCGILFVILHLRKILG